MPSELPGLVGWPPRPALGARVATRRAAPADPRPGPAPEPARREPLPGQRSFLAEKAGPPGEDLPTVAELPVAMIGDRRLADVAFVVLAAVSLLSRGETTCRATDAEISAATAGRPSAKAAPKSLDRLAGCGYLLVGPEPDAETARLIVLPWRLK
jgi:hypothetical protein